VNSKRLLAVGLGTLLIGVPGLACGGGAGGGSGTSVDAFDFGFKAKELTVKPGTTVTWNNTGATTHTVKGGGFFSKAIDPGKSYSFKFTKAGRYTYLCTLHPSLMRGTVVVEQ
jgi:plastocyanin